MFTVYKIADFNPQKMNNNLYAPREVEVYDVFSNQTPHSTHAMFLIYEDGAWVYYECSLFTPNPAESCLYDGALDKPVENFYTTARWKEAINFGNEEEIEK